MKIQWIIPESVKEDSKIIISSQLLEAYLKSQFFKGSQGDIQHRELISLVLHSFLTEIPSPPHSIALETIYDTLLQRERTEISMFSSIKRSYIQYVYDNYSEFFNQVCIHLGLTNPSVDQMFTFLTQQKPGLTWAQLCYIASFIVMAAAPHIQSIYEYLILITLMTMYNTDWVSVDYQKQIMTTFESFLGIPFDPFLTFNLSEFPFSLLYSAFQHFMNQGYMTALTFRKIYSTLTSAITNVAIIPLLEQMDMRGLMIPNSQAPNISYLVFH